MYSECQRQRKISVCGGELNWLNLMTVVQRFRQTTFKARTLVKSRTSLSSVYPAYPRLAFAFPLKPSLVSKVNMALNVHRNYKAY